MSNSENYIKQINRHLYGIQTIQEIAHKAGLLKSIQALQTWQNRRFLITHKNILDKENSKNALEVFIHQLFSLQQFSSPHTDNSKRVTTACKFLPKEMRQVLASALHLNIVSLELDFELAQIVKTTSINQDIYTHAYIKSYNTSLRQQQLTSLKQLGSDFANLNLYWGTASLLALYRKPAQFFELGKLHEFLESTFRTFNQLTNTNTFFTTILAKESELMAEYLPQTSAN